MTKLLALFGCSFHTPTPAAPPDGTPEASRHHRPTWASGSSYAPGPPAEILGRGEPWTGPVRDGLITCAMNTTYRGDRQGFLASLFNQDTRSPDTDGVIWQGPWFVQTSGPSNSSRGTFGASKVNLDDGDELRLTLNDRGFVRSHQYDTLTGTYQGSLPLQLTGTTSTASCTLVPGAVVDEHVQTALRSCEPGFQALAERAPDLQDLDLGRGLDVDPRPSVQDVAALVGWDDTRVRERVERIDAEDARFQLELGEAMVAHRPQMSSRGQTPTLEVDPEPLSCPRFGYRKHGHWSDCGLELAWTPAEGSRAQAYLFDGRGHLVTQPYLWVPMDAPPSTELSWEEPPADATVRMVVRIEDAHPPYQLRIVDGDQIQWVSLGCTGAGC